MRKFTLRELFAIAVVADTRARFGVPLEDLRWLLRHLVESNRDYLRDTAELIVVLGDAVFILTDLRRRCRLAPAFALGALYEAGGFSDPDEGSYILVRLNPIVRKLFERLPADALPESLRRLDYHETARNLMAAKGARNVAKRRFCVSFGTVPSRPSRPSCGTVRSCASPQKRRSQFPTSSP